MAHLAPSLKVLFKELDTAWPKRDRRTDGWYRNCKWVDHGTDHCPTTSGMVHAIDIDKDGINADWVVAQLIRMNGVVRYVIWNRHIWQAKNGWKKENYTGTSNPHTDHIHVSIQHTYTGENWPGPFGIGSLGAKPPPPGGSSPAPSTPAPSGMPTGWDYSKSVGGTADEFTSLASTIAGIARSIARLRM